MTPLGQAGAAVEAHQGERSAVKPAPDQGNILDDEPRDDD